MLRSISYPYAVNAFIFTALWFLIGAIVLWSPLPGALGIGGEMFGAWVVLFFLLLAVAGSLLTIAALNAAFPPHTGAPPRGRALPSRTTSAPWWAPRQGVGPQSSATPPGRGATHHQREG